MNDMSNISVFAAQGLMDDFTKRLSDCSQELLHNFMEDAGGLSGDLDCIAKEVATAIYLGEKLPLNVEFAFWRVIKFLALKEESLKNNLDK